MSLRNGMPATIVVDQQNLVGANHIGLGEFANIRYRGQVFTPTQNTFNALAFQLVALGVSDLAVFLTDVDQGTNLPIGSILASWVIPNSLLSTNLTTYLLTPAYTSLTPGHKYAFYLAPFVNGVYSDDYRDMIMSVSGPYAGGPEIANTNGVWSVDSVYDMVFQMGKATYAARSVASGRSVATARLDTIPPFPPVVPTTVTVPRGIALSGLEFGSAIPGALNTDYFESVAPTFSYFSFKGFNTVRIPFMWERLQPTVGGALDATYKSYLDIMIARANAVGLKVVLDCHNFGRRYVSGILTRIGDSGLTAANFADLWSKIATAYVGNTTVYGYDLMNEPHDMPVATTSGNYNSTSTWTLAAQAAITAIRAVDTNHFILAELDGWAGGQAFTANYGSNPTPWWTDSASKLVYSFHYYFDNDHSGAYALAFASSNNTNISSQITPVMSWAQSHSLHLHCGEFGVPNQVSWQVCLTTFLDLCNTYNVWTNHWAAGDFYSSTTTLQPTNSYNTDALQMAIIGQRKYLGALI